MNVFLKENWALVVALTLPLVFAAFFMMTRAMQTVNITAPAYDFVIRDNSYNANIDFNITNGIIQADFIYPVLYNDTPVRLENTTELYYVRASTMKAESIAINIPDDANYPLKNKQGMRVPLKLELPQNVHYSADQTSPDGFVLEGYYRPRDGNLMTEIFASSRRHNYDSTMALQKSGKRFDIRGLKKHYGYEIVGWVLPQHGQESSSREENKPHAQE